MTHTNDKIPNMPIQYLKDLLPYCQYYCRRKNLYVSSKNKKALDLFLFSVRRNSNNPTSIAKQH